MYIAIHLLKWTGNKFCSVQSYKIASALEFSVGQIISIREKHIVKRLQSRLQSNLT